MHTGVYMYIYIYIYMYPVLSYSGNKRSAPCRIRQTTTWAPDDQFRKVQD